MNVLIPIRGNNLGIAGESDRFANLADQLESVGNAIRSARADSWEGRARDEYDQAQSAMATNWLRAADSHRRAAAELTNYRLTLEDVQVLADSAIADARESGMRPDVVEIVRAQLDRWRGQLDDVGRLAANAIRAANQELAALRRVLRELPVAAPPVPQPAPVAIGEAALPSPFRAGQDRESYRQQLIALNGAVLDAWRTQRFALRGA